MVSLSEAYDLGSSTYRCLNTQVTLLYTAQTFTHVTSLGQI